MGFLRFLCSLLFKKYVLVGQERTEQTEKTNCSSVRNPIDDREGPADHGSNTPLS